MLRDVIAVEPLNDYRLHLTFSDGTEGDVDVAELVTFTGVFEPLRSRSFFEQVVIHPELGVICWPNGADLDTEVLYSEVTRTPLPASEIA
jgi:hypothetical protein